MPFNNNLPLKQATEVLFDLLHEIFKRIIVVAIVIIIAVFGIMKILKKKN